MSNHLTPDENRTLAKLPPFNWQEGQRCKGLRYSYGRVDFCPEHRTSYEHDIPMPDFEGAPAKVCALFDDIAKKDKAPHYVGREIVQKLSWFLPQHPIHIALAKAIAAVVGEK